ncbi:non-ribosomal peptide synthetase [Candidatus Uabimicrobium amorphum]|uniref:Non-ribosomal peptide synthetase n=1 Tax=Uabimicrobium amorphum TaxID=2596890 RepID=A0A5S9F0M8_UABAM|nr:non-ribosomal peptide synthetase [Candidatus Uabimicrobium amorphum]BBM81666.1 non-ribosomal peptide synthetase [Candidatus Uabimicrobium amorphum]
MSHLDKYLEVLSGNTVLRREVVTLGMCGENSLFAGRVGDWTWDVVARLCQVNPYNAKNERGAPTYLSFCYYHIQGNPSVHLRSFGIGSEIEVTSSSYKCDPVSLHTIHRICCDATNGESVTMEEIHNHPRENCLYVENYNRWISRVHVEDNEELSKMQPQDYKYEHLPQMTEEHAPWKVYRKAITHKTFFEEQQDYDFVQEHFFTYQINITRDINGVGLLYFATYFTIFDEAILQLWLSMGGEKHNFMEKKVTDQKICYLGNCNYNTNLTIQSRAWKKGNEYVFNAVVCRENDGKAIAVITSHALMDVDVEKDIPVGESSLASQECQRPKYVMPSNEVEEKVAVLWQELLDVKNVGVEDNFFQLGGHSLLAFNFIFEVQKAFGVNISLQCLSCGKNLRTVAQTIMTLTENKDNHTTLEQITTHYQEASKPFPLTDIQQAYYIGRNELLEMGKVATHFYMELKCDLSLDIAKLTHSWQKLIERHEMLRAVVVEDSCQQVLTEVPSYEILEKNVAKLPEEKQDRCVEEVREEMSHQVFDAHKWPLFDIRVTKTFTCSYLHISIDFLMTDARSLQILFYEWQQLYREDVDIPPLEVSFRDYLLAEHNTIRNNNLYESSKEYWQKRIATLPRSPQLPLIKNVRDSVQMFHRLRFVLPKAKWEAMQKKSEEQGFTPSAILISIFGEVLALWSKNLRFLLNLTLFNRLPLHQQVDQLIGDFTTSLLLEMNYEQHETFAQRVRGIFEQLLVDLDHRYYSGVNVIRDLSVVQKRAGDIVAPVVFTSTIGLAKNGFCPSHFGEETYFITQTSQAWLDCFVFEENGELVVNWFFVKDLFPPQLIEVMFDKYREWIEKFCDEDLWTTEIDIMLPQEQQAHRESVLVTKPASDALLHGLFLQELETRANNPAVIYEDVTLTYYELHKKSCAIANKLREMDVKPNELVAVVMEKGWEQVVAVMGILFSGGAYLPISAQLPQERVNYLLENASIVLTQEQLRDQFVFAKDKFVIDVSTFEGDSTPVPIVQKKEDLAYVIYTSGSTGFPKGVAISHQAAVNTIVDINERFAVTSDDRVLALSALNFDLSVYDIFGILAVGGCIVIPPTKFLREPRHWQELMDKHGVTIWNTVPALMQMLIDSQLQANNRLRLVMMSGDWIPLTLPPQITEQWESCEVISLGGATEAAIWSIFYPIKKIDPAWKSVPYGKPLTNQSFFVFNKKWQSCPDWAIGELFIGGMGVAEEYWKAPEITEKSFVYHPVTKERLYRTGDLGRYLPDGNIEFLGREDAQVKIHGYRIELGEIETHLNKHPLVEEVIVYPMLGHNGEKQLTAYVKSKSLALELKLENKNTRGITCDSIDLPAPSYTQDMYLKRQSYRSFEQGVIPLSSLSQLLSCLLGVSLPGHSIYKYRYPSARGLYPVRTYLYVKPDRVEQLDTGFYYYHPTENCLEPLAKHSLNRQIYASHNRSIFDSCAFAIFFIAHLDAIQPIYGDISSQLCLLEAGYMSQLLMEESPKYNLGLCPVDITQENFSSIDCHFDVEKNDVFLHGFLGGGIDIEQTKEWQQQPLQSKSSIQQMNEFLQNKIPHYMLPKHYVFVDSFPLSANGKVDKSQLPKPTFQSSQQISLPTTLVEKEIAKIWQEVLKINDIHLNSHFFDLGGHSITAIKVFRSIEEKLEVSLPVATLFQHPTLRELSIVVAEKQPQKPEFECLVPIQIGQSSKNFFMVHTVHGYVLEFYKVAEKLGDDFNVYGLEAVGVHGNKPPLTSIEEMAKKYIDEIRIVQPEGPYYLSGRCIGGIIAYEMAQQLLKSGNQVNLLCIIETSNVPGMEGYNSFETSQKRRDEAEKYSKTIRAKVKRILFPTRYKSKRNIQSFIKQEHGIEDLGARMLVAEAVRKAKDSYQLLPYNEPVVLIYSNHKAAITFFEQICSNSKCHIVPSEHFNILLEPHVNTVANIIKKYLQA